MGMAVDENGVVYVADSRNHCIRVIDDGHVTIYAGVGGSAGNRDGSLLTATFYTPMDLCFGPDGALYVADMYNSKIRRIQDGQVSTFAGSGSMGDRGFLDGPAHRARFSWPSGVVVGQDGAVYVADTYGGRIRVIRDGQVSTLAGMGEEGYVDGPAETALFKHPFAVALGARGEVLTTDYAGIRKIEDGVVSTFLPGMKPVQDGATSQASLTFCQGLACSSDGSLFFTETNGQSIRMVRGGHTVTIAGKAYSSGHIDGSAKESMFKNPTKIALGPDGTIFVTEPEENRIRVITGFGFDINAIPLDSAIMLKSAIGFDTDMAISINDTEVRFHRALIECRCPQLLKSALKVRPVDEQAILLFREFVYTDQMPNTCSPQQTLATAVRVR